MGNRRLCHFQNSWLYYTDWFWYMGWTETRFVSQELNLKLSQFGIQLQKSGKNTKEIMRIPRAVDSMFVHLKKVPLSEGDRQQLGHYREKPRL